MHSTTKVSRSNRIRWSFVLVLLMATLGVVVQGQEPMMTSAPTDRISEPTMAPPPDMSPAPVTEAPVAEEPVTEVPVTEEPVTEAPVTEEPVTEAPVTEEPVTEAPVTEAPTDPVATDAPTAAPVTTDSPTAVPTVSPSAPPTVATPQPTGEPSFAPTRGTDAPTAGATQAPSAAATQPSGETQEPAKFVDLQITMTGVDPLDSMAELVWIKETENHYSNFYKDQSQFGISNVASSITVVAQEIPQNRRRGLDWSRNLQNQELQMTYDQTISYDKSSDSTLTVQDVIAQPFASDTAREAYITRLRDSGDPAFADITSVTQVSQDGGSDESNTVGNSSLTVGAVIGIAVGGFAGLVLLCGLGYMCMHRGGGGYEKSSESHPPSTLNLGGVDDVSTLNDPKKSLRAADSVGGYGDQSVATVDYDYSKAYGGGADGSVVSSVGGTLGSQTQATGAGTGLVEGAYSEDASFDAHYQDPNASVKEVALEVWAPPGKLGVVIDTPNDGAPVVHAIKDSSVIADKLQVGDRLCAVDDEDVTCMTAIKVSKLISRKSANATRKLSIVRQVVE